MKDGYGRKIEYMRLSVTDRCNLRCRYCMPEHPAFLPGDELLSFSEMLTLVRCASDIGIRHVRITGGEPLVRPGVVSFIEEVKQLSGIESVSLTTNGIYLKEALPGLKAAGLDSVNISLDTMDESEFFKITGSHKLKDVMGALDACIEAGIRTKINVVPEENFSIDGFLRLIQDKPLDVRFIEMMPMGMGRKFKSIDNNLILSRIRELYPDIRQDDKKHGNGPAVYYKIPGYKGGFGFISAMHGKFCSSCNRIRITADGILKPCLCYGEGFSIKEVLGDRAALKERLIKAITDKPKEHCFEDISNITETKMMQGIGG